MKRVRERHGHTGTATYSTWQAMLKRCRNPRDTKYGNYGGRGITVCDRWAESFVAFLADMGEKPAGGTIDRIDNDRGYEPGNCRWATRAEQARNRSTSKLTASDVEAIRRAHAAGEGGYRPIAERFGVTFGMVAQIVKGNTWR